MFLGPNNFGRTLRIRVDDYFGETSRRDDVRLYFKALIIILWFLASYVLLFFVESSWLQLLLCISYAISACALGFNVFHDANHGSLSSSRHVNLLVSALSSTALGAGRYFWRYKHNVLHHSLVNVFEWDDDIESRGYLRLSPQQPWKSKYENQHRFFFILYGLNTLEWFFVKDFVHYFTLKINHYRPIPPMSTGQKIEFWTSKVVYVIVFVALPFLFFPTGRFLLGFLVFHLTLSLFLTFIFQMAHLVEKVEFPVPSGDPLGISSEWAAHQLRTTANFGNDNALLNWFTGGLNFQIEHHLFPKVSHTHYRKISKIIEETASEFGLPYHSYDSYTSVFRSHYRMVRELGYEPVTQDFGKRRLAA